MTFCGQAQINPVPISHRDICCYVAYLSSFLSYNSLRQYLNVIRLLHLDAGFPNPLTSFSLDFLLRGVKRVLGSPTHPKLPITINLLKGILSTLNLNDSFHRCFWGVCLVAFFSMLRKSNLLPQSHRDSPSVITRGDLVFHPSYLLISIRHAKTIQYQQRVFQVAVPRIPGSPLCPAWTTMQVIQAVSAPDSAPVFMYNTPTGPRPLLYSQFISRLKKSITLLGLPQGEYAAHSMRRGAASFALSCQLPVELIRIQGDWSSNAYQRYLTPPLSDKVNFALSLGRAASLP